MGSPPRLLLAAHGTESPVGSATTAAVSAALREARPAVAVAQCFLDVVGPSLHTALSETDAPTVVVPLLLSTGYHVQSDIPAVVADRAHVRVAPHLGPDALVITALTDRFADARPATSIALVGVGSSRPEARPELERAGALLAERVALPVTVLTLFEDVAETLAGLPAPVAVVPYLLAEGHFFDRLSTATQAAPTATSLARPLGAHPALVSLILARYDAACASWDV